MVVARGLACRPPGSRHCSRHHSAATSRRGRGGGRGAAGAVGAAASSSRHRRRQGICRRRRPCATPRAFLASSSATALLKSEAVSSTAASFNEEGCRVQRHWTLPLSTLSAACLSTQATVRMAVVPWDRGPISRPWLTLQAALGLCWRLLSRSFVLPTDADQDRQSDASASGSALVGRRSAWGASRETAVARVTVASSAGIPRPLPGAAADVRGPSSRRAPAPPPPAAPRVVRARPDRSPMQ